MGIDYSDAAALLDDLFTEAEVAFQTQLPLQIDPSIEKIADTLFASSTQSYREALLGCALARLLDQSINIRYPYVNQGMYAFNGRTLDEKVVNPFLHDRLIPSSKGPYLASFRRSVKFTPETGGGLRDKEGYTAFLAYLEALENADVATARSLAIYLLFRFVKLRDASTIPLSRISRLSLDQFGILLDKLLQVPSGGLLPVLLTVAILRTIKSYFGLTWDVQWQDINVADKASGVGGDVTVMQGDVMILAVEVTERPIEKARVVSTFNTKIVRHAIADYLFIYANSLPTEEAKAAARTYFSQGHEVNFLQVGDWIIHNLGTIGAKGRGIFIQEILALLDTRKVPATVKVAWNDIVRQIVGP
ncbi:SacI restriction endonuclease [Nitrosospira multiformis]|uniref:SacI restriction endonuclease n=1 Tax=Nitrosospira multiformis TaxID=1231 RepID=A0A1H8Q3J5_9PROT|nr:restriction endonuclease, SacI family [Nitrosospira multiformis]SEO48541.1 SacI restriction endonuclease [Nitrosospira multiformis]